MRVQFLFPDLNKPEQELLARLAGLRLAITILCNTPGDEFQEDPQLGTVASSVEREFMDTKMAVFKARILARVTPVQRQALDRNFLAVAFND